jgi:hypothetical protein
MNHLTLVLLFAFLGFTVMPTEAPAFQFNNGDLVLALYGNGTEFYYDAGTESSLLASNAQHTFNIAGLSGSPFNPANGVVGTPQTQWTLLGQFTDPTASPASTGVFSFTGSQKNSQTIAANPSGIPAVGQTTTRLATWNNALLHDTAAAPGAGPGASTFLVNTDPAAFSNSANFGLGGNLSGSWPAGGMQGSLDRTLVMIQGRVRTQANQLNVISDIGAAVLSSAGILSVCGGAGCTPGADTVPVPAAVILFVTGLFGIAAIARRSSLTTAA